MCLLTSSFLRKQKMSDMQRISDPHIPDIYYYLYTLLFSLQLLLTKVLHSHHAYKSRLCVKVNLAALIVTVI